MLYHNVYSLLYLLLQDLYCFSCSSLYRDFVSHIHMLCPLTACRGATYGGLGLCPKRLQEHPSQEKCVADNLHTVPLENGLLSFLMACSRAECVHGSFAIC